MVGDAKKIAIFKLENFIISKSSFCSFSRSDYRSNFIATFTKEIEIERSEKNLIFLKLFRLGIFHRVCQFIVEVLKLFLSKRTRQTFPFSQISILLKFLGKIFRDFFLLFCFVNFIPFAPSSFFSSWLDKIKLIKNSQLIRRVNARRNGKWRKGTRK